MSGLGVVFNRDGAPAEPRAMHAMTDAIGHRGGPRGTWRCGAVAIGSIGSCTSADAGDLHVTFDGRIDNRPELILRLDREDEGDARANDAALALAAYRAWNVAAFERILGDFVVVVWDARERRLVCARDIVGVKPFYYTFDERLFVAGSELQQVLRGSSVAAVPNEGYIAEALCGRFTNRDETLYRNVLRLPPGHVLVVDAHQVGAHRYYDPFPTVDVKYGSDEEYAAHFRSLLSEAVRCRVPADGSIGVYVSGGLDSSSVACMAAELRNQGAIHDTPIIALSMAAGVPKADERQYVDAVVRRWTMTPYQVDPLPPPPDLFADQAQRFLGLPEYPNIVANADLARAAYDAGCRVLLSGLGGDDWLTACYSHCAELLARGRVGECLHQLRVERDAEGGSLWSTLLRRGVWPLLPARMRRVVSRARGRTGVPDHVAPELARRTSLADRMQPRSPNGRRCRSRTQQELYDYYWSGDVPYGFEDQDRHHAWFGLEVRHPFHDRRIIEFLLAVPEDQRWRGAHTKFILRQAMGPLLPDEVRLRLTKSDYTHTFMAALEACGGERCFERLETAERGWIRADIVRTIYRDARARYVAADWRYSHSMYKLWTVYALELWLKYAVA